MLELFVISIQSALPLCLAFSILLAARAYSPRQRRTLARITWIVAATGLVIAALIAALGVLAAVYPARRAARLNILDAVAHA